VIFKSFPHLLALRSSAISLASSCWMMQRSDALNSHPTSTYPLPLLCLPSQFRNPELIHSPKERGMLFLPICSPLALEMALCRAHSSTSALPFVIGISHLLPLIPRHSRHLDESASRRELSYHVPRSPFRVHKHAAFLFQQLMGGLGEPLRRIEISRTLHLSSLLIA
jgi:hypothetical protein